VNEFGWYKGDYFHDWISDMIERKVGNRNATFLELREAGNFKSLYFIGANLSTRFGEVFSYEHTPRHRVADAVRISMSIPLFFASFRSPRGDVYVDGGLLDNYPVKVFDREKYLDEATLEAHGRRSDYYAEHNAELAKTRPQSSPYIYNCETLGFRLDSAREIAVFRDGAEPAVSKIDGFIDYAWALMGTIMDAQGNQHLHSDDWHRTVYIDTLGVSTVDFDLEPAKKRDLVASGRSHTELYFKWYDGESGGEPPKNKPREEIAAASIPKEDAAKRKFTSASKRRRRRRPPSPR
jgi:NTE family protein